MSDTPSPHDPERYCWERVRQALLILLGAIDDYWHFERNVRPKHKR